MEQERENGKKLGEYLGLEDPRARDPGMLTYSQREYLYNPRSVAESSQPTKRQRIRDRVRNALLDFDYLRALRPRDREMVLSKLSEEERETAVRRALWFLYWVSKSTGVGFEAVLEEAVYSAEREFAQGSGHVVMNADVNIDIEREPTVDLREAYEKLERGDSLTDQELGRVCSVVDHGKLKEVIDEFGIDHKEPNGELDR